MRSMVEGAFDPRIPLHRTSCGPLPAKSRGGKGLAPRPSGADQMTAKSLSAMSGLPINVAKWIGAAPAPLPSAS